MPVNGLNVMFPLTTAIKNQDRQANSFALDSRLALELIQNPRYDISHMNKKVRDHLFVSMVDQPKSFQYLDSLASLAQEFNTVVQASIHNGDKPSEKTDIFGGIDIAALSNLEKNKLFAFSHAFLQQVADIQHKVSDFYGGSSNETLLKLGKAETSFPDSLFFRREPMTSQRDISVLRSLRSQTRDQVETLYTSYPAHHPQLFSIIINHG